MKPWAHHGGRQRWWRIRESVVDKDDDTSRQPLRRKIDAEDVVKASMPTTPQGRRHTLVLPMPDVQGRGHN